jgi:hypothetical protein
MSGKELLDQMSDCQLLKLAFATRNKLKITDDNYQIKETPCT